MGISLNNCYFIKIVQRSRSQQGVIGPIRDLLLLGLSYPINTFILRSKKFYLKKKSLSLLYLISAELEEVLTVLRREAHTYSDDTPVTETPNESTYPGIIILVFNTLSV